MVAGAASSLRSVQHKGSLQVWPTGGPRTPGWASVFLSGPLPQYGWRACPGTVCVRVASQLQAGEQWSWSSRACSPNYMRKDSVGRRSPHLLERKTVGTVGKKE